ncbi:MAG TPA: tetratricopeptide repeat protein [Candidatus Paceibacterota bacterium]|nr:tetratricopeptide repeat protein [Candidatus Paceibacterota bacterium]
MDLQKLINEASDFKNSGKLASALSCYNAVMDQLSAEAAEYARSQPDSQLDIGETRRILPKYFEYADSYLRRDNIASRTSNNIGVIFAELKNFDSAKKYFHEAIKYTPENEVYPDPEINLKNLK